METYKPEYGNPNLTEIFEQVGLGSVPSPQILADEFFPAMNELMSNGEIIVAREESAGSLTLEERHGNYFTKMADLWKKSIETPSDPETKQVQRLGRFTGELLAKQVTDGIISLPHNNLLTPHFDSRSGLSTLVIDDHIARELPEDDSKAMSVMDLGAGLAGARFIDWQIQRFRGLSSLPIRPTQYLAIDLGPMQSTFLTVYGAKMYDANLGFGASDKILHKFLITREDGVEPSLGYISSVPGAEQSITAVICNGLGQLNGDMLSRAVQVVPQLIMENGVVEVGLPIEPVVEGGATFDQIAQVFVDQDMEIIAEVTADTGSSNLGRDTVSRFGFFAHSS